ncbi:hypothetical protein CCHOA_03805 [Corynebacterium choanae]|uniref:Uncharacterized protein n=1 Tax=Corynebacterium choanae TaxID=1862358 RepID=A0A3G6J9P8_9CORY|nr:hypothetical protein CCHOA_03805 [Corynebacterium choanae]
MLLVQTLPWPQLAIRRRNSGVSGRWSIASSGAIARAGVEIFCAAVIYRMQYVQLLGISLERLPVFMRYAARSITANETVNTASLVSWWETCCAQHCGVRMEAMPMAVRDWALQVVVHCVVGEMHVAGVEDCVVVVRGRIAAL